MLLGIGLNDTGRALALASLAAGAAALLLENNVTPLREATREGCATFTVTTLDEALRALKNEVRQGRAITVALGGSAEQWLSEMAERGVLPKAIAMARELSGPEESSMAALQGWGAERLVGLGLIGPGEVDLAVLDREAEGAWEIFEDVATSQSDRRSRDAALLTAAMGDDAMSAVQQQWLRAAPTLFPRALSRTYWTTNTGAPPSRS